MFIIRFLLFLVFVWIATVIIGAILTPFLSIEALRKFYAATDTPVLRPLNSFIAWNVEARRFRSHDE